jgi:hypothetical protein
MSDAANGLLAVWMDMPAEKEEDFNRWYNEEHLPEVLACPGFISAVRYECTAGQPRFLAIYELDSEAALTTPEMQRVRGWGEMFAHVRNFHERIYRLIHSAEPRRT